MRKFVVKDLDVFRYSDDVNVVDLSNAYHSVETYGGGRGYTMRGMPCLISYLYEIEKINSGYRSFDGTIKSGYYYYLDKLLNNNFFSFMFLYYKPFEKEVAEYILKNIHFTPFIFIPKNNEQCDIIKVRKFYFSQFTTYFGINITSLWGDYSSKELYSDGVLLNVFDLFYEKMQEIFQMDIDEIIDYVLNNNIYVKANIDELRTFVIVFNHHLLNNENKKYIIDLFENCCDNIINNFPACMNSGVFKYVQIMLLLLEEDRVIKRFENDYVFFSFLLEDRLKKYVSVSKKFPKFFSASGYLKVMRINKNFYDKINSSKNKNYKYMKGKQLYEETSITKSVEDIFLNARNDMNYYDNFLLECKELNCTEDINNLKLVLEEFDLFGQIKKYKKMFTEDYEKEKFSDGLAKILLMFLQAFDEKTEIKIVKELKKKYYDLYFLTDIENKFSWKFESAQSLFNQILFYKKLC
jgi:hypothetical protein